MSSEFAIPPDATIQCPPPLPPATLSFGGQGAAEDVDDDELDGGQNSKSHSHSNNKSGGGGGSSINHHHAVTSISIGRASQVVKERNALLVGRQASKCDIRIAHKSLSREHALLYYRPVAADGGGATRWELCLLDLDTTSGTRVNGSRVTATAKLLDGDTVQFGRAQVFRVRWAADPRDADEVGAGDVVAVAANDATAAGVDATISTGQSEVDFGDESKDTLEGDPKTNGRMIASSKSPQAMEDGTKLSGRAQRQAEIAAMISSLEEAPTYTKQVVPTADDLTSAPGSIARKDRRSGAAGTTTTTIPSVIQKYKLPLTESTTRTNIAGDEGESAQHHHISSVAMDPTGARFSVGSLDSSLKFFDFGGYDANNPLPFQNVIVQDGYPVRALSYSPTGDRLLVATGSASPRLLDRDGSEILSFVRGDVYVRDPTKTIGHTAAVTSVSWHPSDKSLVFTASRDGSLRTWNVDKGKLSFASLCCSEVVATKNPRTGRRTIPTCMAVSVAASVVIALGTECGSLQLFNFPFVSKLRAQQSVHGDEPIVCVAYSADASRLASRTRTTLKVWNTAQRLSPASAPWMVCAGGDGGDAHADAGRLPPVEDVDNCTPTMAFSPDGKVLCVATTTARDGRGAPLSSSLGVWLVPREASLEPSMPVYSLPLPDGGGDAVGLVWHPKLNQLLVATTGGFQIFYSSDWSKKGVLLSAGRLRPKWGGGEQALQDLYASRAPPPGSAVRPEQIITPNSLPLFGGDQHRRGKKKRRLEEDEVDEDTARHIPQKPSKGVYDTHNTIFTQMIMDKQKQIAGKDPREALAAYSEGKSYIGTAYVGNIESILADKTAEQEEDEMLEKKRR